MGVDYTIVWQIIENDLDSLYDEVSKIIASE
jgi:uncharacterized protein with HEPN domain